MAMTGSSLTNELWSSIEDIFKRIIDHPFILGLTNGSLEEDAFRFYVIQDAHYLREYARALSLMSARAPVESDILMFARHAAGAVEVERALHAGFFRDFGIDEETVSRTPVARRTWRTRATC